MSNFPDSLPAGFSSADVKTELLDQDMQSTDFMRDTWHANLPKSFGDEMDALAKRLGISAVKANCCVIEALLGLPLDRQLALQALQRTIAEEMTFDHWVQNTPRVQEVLRRFGATELTYEYITKSYTMSLMVMAAVDSGLINEITLEAV